MIFQKKYNVNIILEDTNLDIELYRIPRIGEQLHLVLYGNRMYRVTNVINNILHNTDKTTYTITTERLK